MVGIVVAIVVIVGSVIGFFVIREHQSPSGKVFVNSSQGKVELHVPNVMAVPPTAAATSVIPDAPSPPTAISIASIGLHADIYLMSTDAPKTKSVGWLYGTAMPGTPGNLVLYGARAGSTAVFDKLDQLQKGDEIAVSTGTVTYIYQAVSEREVSADDTDVMMPTSTATLTLITDAGEWDAGAGRYTKRLVIQAILSERKATEGVWVVGTL